MMMSEEHRTTFFEKEKKKMKEKIRLTLEKDREKYVDEIDVFKTIASEKKDLNADDCPENFYEMIYEDSDEWERGDDDEIEEEEQYRKCEKKKFVERIREKIMRSIILYYFLIKIQFYPLI
jgi:hypothetical protein